MALRERVAEQKAFAYSKWPHKFRRKLTFLFGQIMCLKHVHLPGGIGNEGKLKGNEGIASGNASS